MAVSNSIVKKDTKPSQVTEYESNGEIVRISPTMIRKYLVSGGGNVTDEEVTMFLSLCKFQHLNPFLREAYLIKYGDRQPATMVVGKEVFIKRARKQPEFTGLQAGVIVRNANTGEILEHEGTFYDKANEELVGGWAKCFLIGYQVPLYVSVSLDEYIGRKKDGEINSQWAGKPATMIRKVAISQVLREAFPDVNGGMYGQEELEKAQGVDLEEAVVVADVEMEGNETETAVVASEEDASSVLFG